MGTPAALSNGLADIMLNASTLEHGETKDNRAAVETGGDTRLIEPGH